MEIKSVLYPTDFSEGSASAAPYVLDVARKHGAKVYLMHVIYDIAGDTGWYGTHINTEAIYEEIKKSANEEMERFRSEIMEGYENVELVLQLGTPYEDILWFAQEKEVDMIIIGSHSKKKLGRVLFGSTAMRVVKNAPCPVLTVRAMAAKK